MLTNIISLTYYKLEIETMINIERGKINRDIKVKHPSITNSIK